MKLKAPTNLVLYVLILLIISGIAAGRYFFAYQIATEARANLIQQQLADQQRNIDELQIQTAALLSANQTVAEELKAEAIKRLAAEQISLAAQGKISQLEQNIEQNKAPNTSAIIQEWRPRIAAVDCEWPPRSGKRAVKSGTAVLMSSTNTTSPQLLTSKHVITYLDELPVSCTLTFPDQDEKIKITGANITLSDTKYDWAKITLSNPPTYATLLALTPANRCINTPATGDGVIILGYPKIGTKEDITATEGIISGINDKYYITSAKVERGNSGGAAILTKQNCYLGIPTFADAGQIESLARILDQRVID